MSATSVLARVIPGLAIIVSATAAFAQQTEQLTLPRVTVSVPAIPVSPPYLRDPGTAYQRNPYTGRYRVEEDKFREVPCAATRIASAAGGKCLQGYRLLPGATDQITNPKGGSNCDLALDVVMYSVGNLSIEADTLIFDPYKLTAIGHQTSQFCYVNGNPGYGQEDFQDMNQVTRCGTNWRNLVGDGNDKSIEFSDGSHNCVAVQRAGPKWSAATSTCFMRASAGPTRSQCGPKTLPTRSPHYRFANTTRSAICGRPANNMGMPRPRLSYQRADELASGLTRVSGEPTARAAALESV